MSTRLLFAGIMLLTPLAVFSSRNDIQRQQELLGSVDLDDDRGRSLSAKGNSKESGGNPEEDEDMVLEEEPAHCQDSDCTFSISDGCVAANPESGVTCTYQFKFGDILPSQSCRCAGAGILTAKYGSIEEAFAALSENSDWITLEQFTELLTNYNVPGYTAAYEFQKADINKDGSLDKDEFLTAAEQLMAATTGGITSLGSAGARCCCAKKVIQPDHICVLPSTMEAHSESTSHRGVHPSSYQSSVKITSTGQKCYSSSAHVGSGGHCPGGGIFTKFIYKLGQASPYSSGAQAGSQEYVKFGDALYLRSQAQTYKKCVDIHCSYSRGARSCYSRETCSQYQQMHYCGFADLNTSLIRYSKVGTIGTCTPEKDLQRKMFVSGKVCPSGTYHRTREGQGMQVCDCNDACP